MGINTKDIEKALQGLLGEGVVVKAIPVEKGAIPEEMLNKLKNGAVPGLAAIENLKDMGNLKNLIERVNCDIKQKLDEEQRFHEEIVKVSEKYNRGPIDVLKTLTADFFARACEAKEEVKGGHVNAQKELRIYEERSKHMLDKLLDDPSIESREEVIGSLLFAATMFAGLSEDDDDEEDDVPVKAKENTGKDNRVQNALDELVKAIMNN